MLVRPPLQLNHQTREQIEGSMSNILIHADFFNSVRQASYSAHSGGIMRWKNWV